MWIKTRAGQLVNTDTVNMICYSKNDETVAIIAAQNDAVELSDNDVREKIWDAIRDGKKFLEV